MRLQYATQDRCDAIGEWMYCDGTNPTKMCMEQKYDRYMLFKKLFRGEVAARDRVGLKAQFIFNEKRKQEQVLMNLIKMSQGKIECLANIIQICNVLTDQTQLFLYCHTLKIHLLFSSHLLLAIQSH